jgi:hypothetical protein
MGDGRLEMGEIVTLPMSCIWVGFSHEHDHGHSGTGCGWDSAPSHPGRDELLQGEGHRHAGECGSPTFPC